jgi:hypothetical protein
MANKISPEAPDRLELSGPDEVEHRLAAASRAKWARQDKPPDEAINGLRSLGWCLPHTRFSRDDANERR